MTFNWPEIPFTGAEVDAFVVEYKALAEAIYEDYQNYNVNLNTVKLPFKNGEDVKIFLEYGLVYASFIVKQRAGNSGPGTDFDLNNSPFGLILPSISWDRIFRDTGPIGNNSAIKECFENNQNGNKPGGDDNQCDPDSGEPLSPIEWYIKEVTDGIKDLITDDCPEVTNVLDNTETEEREGNCLAILLSQFFGTFGTLFRDARFTYLTTLTFKLVEKYIKGTGGVYNLSNLHSDVNPVAGIWIREDIIKALNKQSYPLAADLSATDKANYGMNPNGNAYVLNGAIAPGFKNSLGSFTVITDGTEDTFTYSEDLSDVNLAGRTVLNPNGLTNISQIKQVRDDYGFNDYGYTNTRSYTNGDMPGDSIPDSQIKSGTEWVDSNTTPCQAASYSEQRGNSNNPKWNYTDISAYIRYIIASNHGIGKVDPGGYINAPCVGKPYAIHFDWR